MRVRLDPIRRTDAGALISAHRDSRSLHAPWVQPFHDQAGFDHWFERFDDGGDIGLVARDAGSGLLVGLVGLSQISRGAFQNACLGYHGMAGGTGRGLMTEAVRLAVLQAFGPLALHRVEANIQPGNVRSIALIRRLGFRCEGLSPGFLHIDGAWRDHQRWALRADEPQPGLGTG